MSALPRRRTITAEVAVVGGGPLGCATAWALARRGVRVVLVERLPAALVRQAAGPAAWAEDRDDPGLASEARHLWRLLEHETGSDLLNGPVSGLRRVPADRATAALTAAAIGRGAVLRRDEAQVVEQLHEVEVCTGTAAIRARSVVLTGARPAALVGGGRPVRGRAARGAPVGPRVRRPGRGVVPRAGAGPRDRRSRARRITRTRCPRNVGEGTCVTIDHKTSPALNVPVRTFSGRRTGRVCSPRAGTSARVTR